MQCSLTKISGDVLLDDGFASRGCVYFNGAQIGGNLDCSGGSFDNAGETAIAAQGLRADGNVVLTRGSLIKGQRWDFTAKGEVRLRRARLGGNLDCSGGKFSNTGKTAIVGEDLHADGNVLLRDGFMANGQVWFLGADIAGTLDCNGGRFDNVSGTAIEIGNAKVGHDANLGNGFVSNGAVRLMAATIGGDLNCSGGTFLNPREFAILGDRARISGNVSFSPSTHEPRIPFKASGSVSFDGAEIGALDCSGGSFGSEQGPGFALGCSRAAIKRGAFLTQIVRQQSYDRFEACGGVLFVAADIDGGLWCSGGFFRGSRSTDDRGQSQFGTALDCSLARIKGGASLSHLGTGPIEPAQQFQSLGEVSFQAAQIEGHFDCAGGRFVNPTGVALRCQAATITG